MEVSVPRISRRMRALPLSISTADADPNPIRDWDKFHEAARKEREMTRDRDGGDGRGREQGLSPASTEVISSLITSLSDAGRPSSSYLDAAALRLHPELVDEGPSFGGVHYSASQELERPMGPATSTAMRAAKMPNRPSRSRSPQKSTTGDTLSRSRRQVASRTLSMVSASESIGGASIRKPSIGNPSIGNPSIGNPSIEPGPLSPGSPEELRRQKSFDSWGKKTSRRASASAAVPAFGHKSSRERMRGKETDKDKNKTTDRLPVPESTSMTACTDAATANRVTMINKEITEARRLETESNTRNTQVSPLVHVPVPERDSSLWLPPRRPLSDMRTSESTRQDRQHQHQHHQHQHRQHQHHQHQHHHHQHRQYFDLTVNDVSVDLARRSFGASASFSRPQPHGYGPSPSRNSRPRAVGAEIDECAPAPSVSQRRSSELLADTRRRSSRQAQARHMGYAAAAVADDGAGAGAKHDHVYPAFERSGSADSIDGDVGKYLGNPRLSQTIQDSQTGRVISFSEVGDPKGNAVFCCVGMGLTRYVTAFYDELALTLKLRLITPDRPGVGDSEPYAEGTATPLGWPDDVHAICQHLRITKFSIIAHSAGAIYALATALRMPQHMRGKMHLLAPWIPPSQMTVLGASAQTPLPPQKAMPTSQRILRALPTPILKAANSSFMSATSSSITTSLPRQKKSNIRRDRDRWSAVPPRSASANAKEYDAAADEPPPLKMPMSLDLASAFSETMDGIHPDGTSPAAMKFSSGHALPDELDRERQQTYDERLTQAIWQLATTGANPAVDLLVCLERRHPIGFRYVDITRPVVIHHGTRDSRVPVDNVLWLGKTMRRCEVRVLEGEGHGLMANAHVMGAVLMEVSSEWEEWSRVTGAINREKDGEKTKKGSLAIGTAC